MASVKPIKTLEKKGPGRPTKNKPKRKLERLGIVDSPSNKEASDNHVNIVEISYEEPQTIKKIFSLFKSYNSSQIGAVFSQNKAYFFSPDHNKRVLIYSELMCSKMNRYFCSETVEIMLDTQYFHNILQGINKSWEQIIFYTTKADKNLRLWMRFEKLGSKSEYEIEIRELDNDLKKVKNDIETKLTDSQEYPISFELPCKELKEKVTELYRTSPKVNFNQMQGFKKVKNEMVKTPFISMTCMSEDSKVKNNSPYTIPEEINLQTSFTGRFFTAPIFSNDIKPFASYIISEKIIIKMDSEKDMIFLSKLDFDIEKNKKLENSEKFQVLIFAKLASSNDKN